MKNRDEYLESIFIKRDAKIKEHKKRISVITSVFCLAVCFAAAFAFVPKRITNKPSATGNSINNAEKNIFIDTTKTDDCTAYSENLYTFAVTYPVILNHSKVLVTDNAGQNRNMNESEIKANATNEIAESGDKLQTEIAAEATTKQVNFGYSGEPFDPDLLISGEPAIAPAEPPEDFGTEVSEPYKESPDSACSEDEIKSTSAAKTRTSEEAIAEAKKIISEEYTSKIIDEKTMVTVTRTASGKTTYTVYFYTQYKSFIIELDAVTLRVIECKEKNLISGKDSYYSPAHFPETTAALPEYKPQ